MAAVFLIDRGFADAWVALEPHPGVLGALLLILRTALEDRTLLEELDGYEEYAQQVRYRLLPGVW